MTKADAIPQGTNKLSPSDRIPSSEQAGPDVGLGEGGRGGGCKENQREKETETQAGNGGHVMWLRGETTEPKRGKENVGFVKEPRKTAKERQSSLTFTVPCSLPKALQSSGS